MNKYYNAAETEKAVQKFWEEQEIYKFEEVRGKEIFSIDTPPPTVSGSLHIGHIFSYTQAEIIARYRRMRGDNVFYPFGFDDNGLPTERLVERRLGVRAGDLPREEFIARCAEAAGEEVAAFKSLWKSLGFSCDWSLGYETISPMVQRISQRSFLELARQGRAYAKESPVLWCTECGTSIAQAELETKEADTAFNYVEFAVNGEKPLIVATTRPELLYGCVCLFVNPEDGRYAGYVGKRARVPLYGYEIPVLTDAKVAMDKGTGVVMCATFGDSTDAEWFGEHKLPYRKVILADGTVNGDVPLIAGRRVKAARGEILRLLGEAGLLVKSETLSHMVAVHERCGREVEIIPSRQWYIDVLSEKERFLRAGDEVNWYPAHMKSRYTAWVENLKWDWCISRQRFFGVPFPVWYCKNCGTPVFAELDRLPVNPMEEPYGGRCSCGYGEFAPETAVMDTWATSSLTPAINARMGEPDERRGILPMGMRCQAHEIIRTWAFYTIVKSLYHTGRIPWKDIMISGFVLAKRGEKVSKSKNNASLSPPELIARHSADAVRYWAAASRLGTDTFFTEEDLQGAKRFLTKLWNAFKFAASRLEDFDPGAGRPALLPVDRWILERCGQACDRAASYLDEYEMGLARHEIEELFWKDFCDNYLEIVKERLYRPELHGEAQRRSGQWALYHALLEILKLYAPYVPHITEHLYQSLFREYEGAVSLHSLELRPEGGRDRALLSFGEELKEAVASMRKYKSERGLSMKAELEELAVECSPELAEWFRLTEKDLAAVSNAEKVTLRERNDR